jgi:hypothetical protein
MEIDGPIRKGGGRTAKDTMIILRIRVISRKEDLSVGPVYTSAVGLKAIQYRLSINERLQFRRQ